jgi:hypothetical protein
MPGPAGGCILADMNPVPESAIEKPLATDLPAVQVTDLGELRGLRWMGSVGEALGQRSDSAFVAVFHWDGALPLVVRHVHVAGGGNPVAENARLSYFHVDRDGVPVDHRTQAPLGAVRALALLGDFLPSPGYTPTTTPRIGGRCVFIPQGDGPGIRGVVLAAEADGIVIRPDGEDGEPRRLERHAYTMFYDLRA